MAFDINFTEEAIIKNHIKKFLLYPRFWKDRKNHIKSSLTWNFCKFNSKNKSMVPSKSGVYCFVVKPSVPNFFETSYLFYVGKTNRTLLERYSEYLDDQLGKGKPRKKIYSMLKLYGDDIYFYYTEILTKKEVNISEEMLLNTFVPHVNTSIPKAKIKSELKYIYE